MYNKRLLLLGFTIIGSGWIYPNQTDVQADVFSVSNDATALRPLTDTERLISPDVSSPDISSVNALAGANLTSRNSQTYLFSELFQATSVGGSNGVKLNPKALNFIQDYMKENWDELQLVRTTGGPYFNLIEGILTQYDLPKELKYLAVIESNLKSSAVSRVGAVGPWQLMPQTARDLGLKVNKTVDDAGITIRAPAPPRFIFRDLYNQLGDWLLVIAAYNTGTNNVYHAIHKSGSRNFWDLQYYLPAESRIHVKKFIGTQYVFEGQGSVTTLTRDEAMEQLSGSAMYVFHRQLSSQELNNAKTTAVSGKYLSAVIANYTMMDLATFSRYNPDFDKIMASSNNSYDLKLPADKMELFAANKYQILTESMQQLAAGETEAEGQRLAVVAVK